MAFGILEIPLATRIWLIEIRFRMPIIHSIGKRTLSDQEFDEIDEVVMRCAYQCQNELGRLCEEAVYENDLAARLRAERFREVHTQAPVEVTFRGFSKVYRLDLVVEGMIYELKAVDRLSAAHDAQVFHYGALVGTDRIKLLNFGGATVEGRLRRCPFRRVNRFDIAVDLDRWQPLSDQCRSLSQTAADCLREWGGFLDGHLFEEALIHFLGGDAVCVTRAPVTREGRILGYHRVARHDEKVGFVITSLEDGTHHEMNIRSLLRCLPLMGFQWLNIRGTTIQMITIEC
jgi:GxxExxY protein